MTEIAQLFENALRQNRSTLLRQAAMRTVERMSADTTLRELLETDAADAVRELSLADLADSLRAHSQAGRRTPTARRVDVALVEDGREASASREERLYLEILEALAAQPLTIGQLARRLELDSAELRGYLSWMKKMGKVEATGRARATRYHAVEIR